jgi:hypothetical protein
MNFNPNMMSLNDMAKISPMGNTAMGIYGSVLSPEMQQQMMPMGMMNRTGQEFMGQQQPQQPMPQQGMSQGDMMKLAGMAMQGFNRGQQGVQAPTQQIIRDSNQFRFAGMQQSPQMLANALRKR